MKNLLIACFMFAGFVCDSPNAPSDPKPGEEFDVPYGKSVHIQDANITVTFKSLLEDSRCPEGAVCIWAGNARVGIATADSEFVLNTTLDPKQIEHQGYTLTLISVRPYPKVDEQHPAENYTVRLVVKK